MDDIVYLATTGAQQTLAAQGVHANNLANVNTAGFRGDFVRFHTEAVEGDGLQTRSYVVLDEAGTDLTPSTLYTTGNPLDIGVQGKGYIAVQAPNGEEAYTRAGNLQIDPTGVLKTGAGHIVLGNSGPISIPPANHIDIGSDGTISLRPLGQEASALAVLDRIKLVNPDPTTIAKAEDGLLRINSGGVAPADANVKVASGMLESSNVNAVDALTNVMHLARMYEIQLKIVANAKANAEQTTQSTGL